MELILSTSEIATFFGVTRHAIQKWFKNDCPKISHGKCNLKAVFDWWWENIASYHTPEILDSTMEDARREYWTAKAEGERIKVDQLKESLVSWEEIEKEWCARVAVVTSGLSAFADRLPPLLEGKTRPQMQKVIRDEVWQLRDGYTRKGRYTPKPITKKRNSKAKKRKERR